MTVALLTYPQAAERLAVTERMMHRLVEEKRIPYVKVGKFVRFDPADLDAYIAANKTGGGEWRGTVASVRLHPRRRKQAS